MTAIVVVSVLVCYRPTHLAWPRSRELWNLMSATSFVQFIQFKMWRITPGVSWSTVSPVDKASIVQIQGDDFICLSVVWGASALMASAADKQRPEWWKSEFCFCQHCLWFCLETFEKDWNLCLQLETWFTKAIHTVAVQFMYVACHCKDCVAIMADSH